MNYTLNGIRVSIIGDEITTEEEKAIVYAYTPPTIEPDRRNARYHINGAEYVYQREISGEGGYLVRSSDEIYVADHAIYIGIACTPYIIRDSGVWVIPLKGKERGPWASIPSLLKDVRKWNGLQEDGDAHKVLEDE